MADIVFNVAKGRLVELHDRVNNADPSTSRLIAVLLQTVATDATLRDQATLAAVLAGGSVECDFTNYARITLTASDIAGSAVDNATDRRSVDLPDLVWASAGGTANNTILKLVICYDPNAGAGVDDTRLVPMAAYDVREPVGGTIGQATNGGSITLQAHADGYAYAS